MVALYIAAAIIVIVHVALLSGMASSAIIETTIRMKKVDIPKASVVIPAKNEEDNLPDLFDSLKKQSLKDVEIVLVNDRSEDKTGELMDQFSKEMGERVKVVHIDHAPEHKNPKQHALHHGVAVTTTDVILLTDADCVFGETWAYNMAKAFADPKVGLIIAPIMLEGQRTFPQQYQKFDHIFRYFYAACSAGLGVPTGGFGNNMAVRKSALMELGGFLGLKYSVTEDAELISEIRGLGKWKVLSFTDHTIGVKTKPQKGLKNHIRQAVRWSTGGIFAPDIPTRISYSYIMFYLVYGIIALPLVVINPLFALPMIQNLVIMEIMAFTAFVKMKRGILEILMTPFNVVFSIFFYAFTTILVIFRINVKWKGVKMKKMEI